MNNDEHEHIGAACKHCGHPSGAHEALWGEDLDEPERGDNCRYEGCECPDFTE